MNSQTFRAQILEYVRDEKGSVPEESLFIESHIPYRAMRTEIDALILERRLNRTSPNGSFILEMTQAGYQELRRYEDARRSELARLEREGKT